MANALLLALAMVGQTAAAPASGPSDEYGYVSWCYGALGGYLDLYDQVMPEVTRIEKAFPGPDGVAASLKTYPEMRAQARLDMKTYGLAITAAEKASPRPISEYGRASVKKGRSVWAGADTTNKARLAQIWMSWSPPGDCESRAKTLETRSNVLGKALIYNARTAADMTTGKAEAAAPPAAEPTPAPAPPVEQTPEAPAPAPVAPPPVATTEKAPAKAPATKPAVTKAATTPQAKPPQAKNTPAQTTAKPAATKPAPAKATTVAAAKPTPAPAAAKPAAKGEFIVDFADPKPCPGRLESAKRGGKDVLVCKPE